MIAQVERQVEVYTTLQNATAPRSAYFAVHDSTQEHSALLMTTSYMGAD